MKQKRLHPDDCILITVERDNRQDYTKDLAFKKNGYDNLLDNAYWNNAGADQTLLETPLINNYQQVNPARRVTGKQKFLMFAGAVAILAVVKG